MYNVCVYINVMNTSSFYWEYFAHKWTMSVMCKLINCNKQFLLH